MHKKRIATALMSFLLVGGICNVGAITSHAEEMPGYHEYVNTEDEAIDTWYGIARGTYLKDGTSGIKRSGTCLVSVSGTTTKVPMVANILEILPAIILRKRTQLPVTEARRIFL